MPSVSGAQHRKMAANCEGSQHDIPKKTACEFMHADKGNPAARGTFHKAMQGHGVARGDGQHRRHPSTSHYSMGREGNKYRSRS